MVNLSLDDIKNKHREGDLETAHTLYLSYLESHPNNAEAHHLLGLLLAEMGELDKAEVQLQIAIKLERDVTYLIHLANILKAKGKYNEAISIFKEVIDAEPNWPVPYNNLGTVYFQMGNWSQSVECYQSAINLKADYIDAYYNLGLAHIKLNEKKQAVVSFKAIIELNKNHPGARFQLGRLALEEGLSSQQKLESRVKMLTAIEHFAILESLHPFHFETLTNLATCYLRLGRLQEAKDRYLAALNIVPDDPQILFNLGVITTILGKISDAIQFYLRLLENHPDNFSARNNLGVIYLMMKDKENALHHFQAALKLDPRNKSLEHILSIIKGEKTVAASPPAYIASLFDSYADHYEAHLQALKYDVPSIIEKVILKFLTHKDNRILDLGCGTGLCGALIKPYAKELIGVDISTKMLAQAKQKKCYDELIESEIVEFLDNVKTTQYDFIIAADVLVYFGDLNNIFSKIPHLLKKEGFFIFNVEINTKENFCMLPTGRFSHSLQYISELSHQYHLSLRQSLNITLRKEDNIDVPGCLYVLSHV